jgi:hypothetical protein
MSGESFFVDSQGSVTTSPSPSAPQLGHYERTCSGCGREWRMDRAECACGSHELTERYHEPSLLERGPLGAIRAVVMPKPEKVKPADPEDTAALRELAAAGRAYADALVAADQAARRIVRAEKGTRETTGYVQFKLAVAVDTVSDFSMANLSPVFKPVLALTEMIETALDRLDQELQQ